MSGNEAITFLSTGAQQDALNTNKSTNNTPSPNGMSHALDTTPSRFLRCSFVMTTRTNTYRSTGDDSRDFEENTPLLTAAQEGHYDTAKTLLDQGAHPDSQNVYGYTPLLSAVSRGHLQLAKLLVERGANVHLTTLEVWNY